MKNKIWAVLLVVLGALPMALFGEGTFFIFALVLAVPAFIPTKRKDGYLK